MIHWFVLVPALLVAWAVWTYNRLVRLRNQVKTAWADVDVQLTRRHDLIPNLVAAVKAYASHEKALLENVAALREQALATRSPQRLGQVEGQLEQGLSSLLAVQEAYPDLKANQNFAQLQADLVKVEDHLQYARRFYDGAVRDLNDGIQKFPDSLIAGAFGFAPAEFFSAADGARAAVAVGVMQ
ncbi:MAG: LemA family protein [Proteobacteria bacterium]|nr:LemA family protein [Pseudomonadota bacterium]MBS0461648.1 LemA family protein [Pseudomonadota bacterium]MBS0464354.1 LemA family protein [Pseudomonadota bacterium]